MSEKVQAQRTAIIYGGAGVSLAPGDTVEALESVATHAGFAVRRFVQRRPGSKDPTLVESLPGGQLGGELSAADLAAATVWLAPGSDQGATFFGGWGIGRLRKGGKNNYATYNLLRAAGYDKWLKDAVHQGLGYVGICAGAYLGANADHLDLIGAGAMWARNAGSKDWKVQASLPGVGVTPASYRWVLLAGPSFDVLRVRGRALEIVARFEGDGEVGGQPAAVSFQAGAGRVFLCGPHPEAPNDAGWDAGGSSSWRTAPRSVESNHAFLAAWMNAVARQQRTSDVAA
jgi:hypothetical protein